MKSEVSASDYKEVICQANSKLYRHAKAREHRIPAECKEVTIYKGEKLSSVLRRLGEVEGVHYFLDRNSADIELDGVDGYKILTFNDLSDYVSTIMPNYELVIEKNHYYKKLPKVVKVVERNTLADLDAIDFDSRYVQVPSRLFNIINSMLKRKGWAIVDDADVKQLFNKETTVNFQGSLRAFLQYFAKNNNLFVDFDYTKKRIVFSRYKVKHFPLNLPTAKYEFSNTLSMDTSNSKAQKSSNKLSINNTYNAVETIKNAMGRIFGTNQKQSGDEYWFYLDTVNELVVKADPKKLHAVEEVVKSVNEKALKQVMVKLTVYEVDLNRDSQFGIDWNYVYKNATQLGMVSNNGGVLPSFSLDFGNRENSPAMFKFTNRNQKGLSFIVNLLKKFGRTKMAYQMPVVTTNNIPAVYNIASKQGYVKSLTINTDTGATVNGGVNIEVQQDDAISGQYIYVKPTIIGDDRIMLSLKMIFSFVKNIERQDFQNGMYIQTPQIDENVYSQNLIINDGERVVIGGFTIKNVSKDFKGLTDTPTFLTGLDKDVKANKEIVLVIEAKEI